MHAEAPRLSDVGVTVIREAREGFWGLIEAWTEDPGGGVVGACGWLGIGLAQGAVAGFSGR